MANSHSEILLSKANVDRIFSFNKTQWVQAAPRMRSPGWEIKVLQRHSGSHIIGCYPSTGIVVAVKPFFPDETRVPDVVIIDNYFPLRPQPAPTNEMKKEMEAAAQNEVGPAYSLTLEHEITDTMEILEFFITEV